MEEEKNLHKTFFIQLESQQDNLYSIYLSFLKIFSQKQQDQVYKKWMQFPKKNEAYILSVQKEETKKRISNLYQQSKWPEQKIQNLKWKEIQVDDEIIRIVKYQNDSDSQQEILQAKRYSEFAIIHNIGSDQYEIQKFSLENCVNQSIQKQIGEQEQDGRQNNLIENELGINDNQFAQNNSDEITNYQKQLEENETLIFNLKQENQNNLLIINNLNNQIIESKNHFEDSYEKLKSQEEEDKQVIYRLKTELEKINQTIEQEKQLSNELKDKLKSKENDLEEEKSKFSASEKENNKNYQEKLDFQEKNLKLIEEYNELGKEHNKDKHDLQKITKKYLKKKDKYLKLKEKMLISREEMENEMEKTRQEIDYIKSQFQDKEIQLKQTVNLMKEQQNLIKKSENLLKEKENSIKEKINFIQEKDNLIQQKQNHIREQENQIKKFYLNLDSCEQKKNEFQSKYYELRNQHDNHQYGSIMNINKALDFEDTPITNYRDKFLQHRNNFRSAQSNFKQNVSCNQYDTLSQSKDYFNDSFNKQSLNQLSVEEKNSMNKDFTHQADIFTLHSQLKEVKVSPDKEASQNHSILQTLEEQKIFVQNYQSNQKQNILDCLDNYQQQLKFEYQSCESLDQISLDNILQQLDQYDQCPSISQLSDSQQEIKSQKPSPVNEINPLQEIKNNEKVFKKNRQFKDKSKYSPSKHQQMIKKQNPSKIFHNKNHKQKYLQQKRLNEKQLNKQINNQHNTKPHLKKKFQEQINQKTHQHNSDRQNNTNKTQSQNNRNNQYSQNISLKSLFLTNRNHISKEITKKQ